MAPPLAPLRSVSSALSTPTFAVQVLITVLVNLLVNLGLPYGTYSNWGGRTRPGQFPAVGFWSWNYEVGSCIALDLALTHFLLLCVGTWASTGGAQKDVRERKCAALEPAALARRPWSLTPVNVRSLLWRGVAMGVYGSILPGVPVALLVWAAVGNGTWGGYSYVLAKGIYAGLLLAPAAYVIIFLSAIDRRNFPELAAADAAGEPDASLSSGAGDYVPTGFAGAGDKEARMPLAR